MMNDQFSPTVFNPSAAGAAAEQHMWCPKMGFPQHICYDSYSRAGSMSVEKQLVMKRESHNFTCLALTGAGLRWEGQVRARAQRGCAEGCLNNLAQLKFH